MNDITYNIFVSPKDDEYLEEMMNRYISENEKQFFEVLNYKMHKEPAPANDLIMDEENNEDGLYLIRVYDSEFIIGIHVGSQFAEEVHTMGFKECMTTNLKESGLLNKDITLLEWLRERDYKGVEYNHNFNLM